MNILICSDKYKGSLAAQKVCRTLRDGIIRSDPSHCCNLLPLADGGDGTGIVLKELLELSEVWHDVIDPLGRPIRARYYHNAKTAYVELAEASGMWRLKQEELDVVATTSIGTGQLMQAAIDDGYQHIVLCLGGSCTSEMGLGIAYALGFCFLDRKGNEIVPKGGNLLEIADVVKPILPDLDLTIFCDVNNPLYGPSGAAHIYAHQKGASEIQIELLDKGAKHIANYLLHNYGCNVANFRGAGAAGGVAAGLSGLLPKVEVVNGLDYLGPLLNLSHHIANADLIVTGEGRLDTQSLDGKVIGRVAKLAKDYEIPVIAVVGQCALKPTDLIKAGIVDCLSLIDYAGSEEKAINEASSILMKIGEQLGRDIWRYRKRN